MRQEEYNASKFSYRNLKAKIYLLNFNFQIVDEWENIVIGSPSFSINAESDLRRSCNISLIPIDKSFNIEKGNKIWIDKYIDIELGIKDIYKDEYIYTKMGIYLINNPNRVYSATENTLNIQGIDLMSKMTGLRNGNLKGIRHLIPQGYNVRKAIIETIKLAGFNKYVVEECPYTVPNDINIDIGGTVYDILKNLKDILPNYQMYFDSYGVFYYNKIPTGKNEQIMVDDDIWSDLLVSYNINTDFENVKNVIEVFGKTHDIKYYSNVTTINNSIYLLNISTINKLRNNLKIGFTATSKVNNPYIKLNNFPEKPLKNEDGTFAILEERENVYYVAKFLEEKDYYLFMGEITPYAISKEENPNSPFYINGTAGEINIVLSGGEYDNIYMSSLAKIRADWELYTRCKIKDNISINCVPIYWLDVNWLVRITLPNKNGIEETNLYIIKNINTSFDVNGTQQITLMRYYPFYSDLL